MPVILAGIQGISVWPLSRSSYIKQYLSLDEENKYTLLQNTYLRLKGIKNLFPPLVIFNPKKNASNQCISKIYLLEPGSKNTASAITLA